MRWLLCACLFFSTIRLSAQTIKGKVVDSAGQVVKGAVISLIDSTTHRTVAYALSKVDGSFQMEYSKEYSGSKFILSVRHIGFQEYRKSVDLLEFNRQNIVLTPSTKELKEIIVQSDLPIQVQGDTTVFNALKYITPEDKKLKDLFNKMPGFRVNEKGRLTYKGNDVEKLFVDGDDVAGNKYELLTKNAPVDFVQKVEVFEHFDDDRLMRSVRQTDAVGVNLITKESYRMKLTGTGDLSASFEKKQMVDLTTTLLGKKFKQLNFGNANNAGQNLDENFKGEIYESNDEKMKMVLDDDKEQRITVDQLRLPQMDDRIMLHNNDVGAFSVMSLKSTGLTKWNGQFGGSKTSQWIQRNNTSRYSLGGINNWSNKSLERQEMNNFGIYSAISFKRDNGGDYTSNGSVVLKTERKHDTYTNFTTGSVQDSLREGLKGLFWQYLAKWNHTLRVGKHVLRIFLRSELNDGRQDFSTQTLRLLSFFKLDSAYKTYLQNSLTGIQKHSLEIRLNGKQKKQSFELGWNTSCAKNTAAFEQRSYSIKELDPLFLNASNLTTSFFTSGVYGKTKYSLSPKLNLDAFGRIGVSRLTQNERLFVIPDFKGEVKVRRELSKRMNAFLMVEWEQAFSDWLKFMPPMILTSNASFGSGLQYSGPAESYSISGGLLSVNIFKNSSFLVNASYTRSTFTYGSSSILFPEYSIAGFERYPDYSSFSFLVAKKFFVPSIKSIINLNANWMDNIGGFRQNGLYAIQRFTNSSVGAEFSTGLNGPINFKLEGRVVFSRNQWAELPVVSNVQYNWNGKFTYKVNKQIYLAGRWKYFQLAPRVGFDAVDAFVLWNVGEKFDIKLEAINLLNRSTIEQRSISAVNETISAFLLNKRFLLFNVSFKF